MRTRCCQPELFLFIVIFKKAPDQKVGGFLVELVATHKVVSLLQ
jgi:hypothetical protein